MTGEPFDRDVLGHLVGNVGPAGAKTLVHLFIGEARSRVARITDLARRYDWEAVRREAHALKSTGATYGLTAVAEQAGALEAACADGRGNDAAREAEGLTAVIDPALAALAQFIDAAG